MLRHVWLAAKGLGLPVVVVRKDLLPGRGPLGGIHTAMESSKEESLLFIPCDMPRLTSDSLRLILDAGMPGRRHCFTLAGGKAGFPILLHKNARGVVSSMLEEGVLALRTLRERLGAQLVSLGPEREAELENINSPGEIPAGSSYRPLG